MRTLSLSMAGTVQNCAKMAIKGYIFFQKSYYSFAWLELLTYLCRYRAKKELAINLQKPVFSCSLTELACQLYLKQSIIYTGKRVF